jgi:hypothetical protein
MLVIDVLEPTDFQKRSCQNVDPPRWRPMERYQAVVTSALHESRELTCHPMLARMQRSRVDRYA